MGLTTGWLELNDGAKLVEFEEWESDIKMDLEMEIERTISDSLISFDLLAIERVIKVKGLHFSSKADIEEFIALMKTLNSSNSTSGWKLEINTISTNSYFKFDGSTAYMNVFCSRIQGIKKISPGDQQYYMISQVQFVEASR